MGREIGVGASSARNIVVMQALGWIALLVSNVRPDRYLFNNLFATLAVAGFGFSNWYLFLALESWLGPRPGRFVVLALAALIPVGYAMLFHNYALRIAWANSLLGAQFVLLAWATLRPALTPVGRWRWALALCSIVMIPLSFGRAILGGFFADAYPNFMTPHPFSLFHLLFTNLTLLLTNVSLLVAWREEAEQQLREQAITDPLTTVLNRRGWDEAITRVFAHARRHRQPLTLLLIDLDHFKRINDTRGHEAGDAALRFFGRILHREQRAGDVVARIGGEEFCVLMPMTDEVAARAFDQRLRDLLATWATIRLDHPLDFSTGLARLQDNDENFATLAQRADRALYRAKMEGRGRLVSL